MSTSPWLTPTISPAPTPGGNSSMSTELDPWAGSSNNDLLRVSNNPGSQGILRSRKTPSPAFGSPSGSRLPSSASEVVDRHPLRSPSPSHHVTSTRPSQPARRPSAVASEWKAIGAGLAGLFNGSSSTTDSNGYKWPADPVSSTSSRNQNDEVHKGHPGDRIESTLDRLEDWFGLKDSRVSPLPASGIPRQPPTRGSVFTKHAPGKAEDVRVLIHPVAPTDTLSSLALHYGADIHVLRKSNKLWPGDPVQIRRIIYVPVDSCKHRPPNAEIKVLPSQGGAISTPGVDAVSALAFVPKEEDDDTSVATISGGLADLSMPNSQLTSTPLVSIADPASDFLPDTNKSYADNQLGESSLGRTGSINGPRQAYPANLAPSMRNAHGGRPPSRSTSSVGGGSASASATSSSFIPPHGPIHVSKVPADKLRFFANDRKSSSTGSSGGKPGQGDATYDPGESGIDDLLALRHEHAQPPVKEAPRQLIPVSRPELLRHESVSNTSDTEEEEWKPNTWHFGNPTVSKGKHRSQDDSDASVAIPRGYHPHGDEAGHASQPNLAYAGWNDAPPTNATIAKAYDGGRAYKKRQAQKSNRLLYDLAAGLPPNPGAASKWARPIQFGDSLPGAPSGSIHPIGNGDGKPGPGAAVSGKPPSASRGFGKLLDDTIRGRISVEAALEGALEGVRASTQSSPVAVRRQPPAVSHSIQPLPRQPRETLQQEALRTSQEQASGFRDPLSAPAPSPVAGLSKRRVDWTRSAKAD